MKFINITGNTVELNDIGRNIAYIGNIEQSIDTQDILKSKAFQGLVISGHFAITEINDHRIEKNMLKHQSKEEPVESITVNVMFRGNLTNNTGYAKANRSLVYALNRNGVRVGVEFIKESNTLNEYDLSRIEQFKRRIDPAIQIVSGIPTMTERTSEHYSILNTTVESCTIPVQFAVACNKYDEVWVVSDFCKETLLNAGVEKEIFVIPNAVDSRLYNNRAKPLKFKPPINKFVFVSVMSWNYRKGYDVLLKAYTREFTKNDPVTLLIVTPYQFNAQHIRKSETDDYISGFVSDTSPQIVRHGQSINEVDMPRLYRSCNCFVSASRGEGFLLPAVEAGMCGLPVIATNYSGQTMYLTEDNSYLLPIDKLDRIPIGSTGVHFWDEQVFPSLSDDNTISGLGKIMRTAYEDTQQSNRKAKSLHDLLVGSYSLDAVGVMAKKRLETIWQQINH